MLELRSRSYLENPYPVYATLRSEAPICQTEPFGFWAVSRYADVVTVLKNPQLFSSLGMGALFEPGSDQNQVSQAQSMIGLDPPDHTRLRGIVSEAFSPLAISDLEPGIRKITRTLIDNILRSGGSFDLVRDLSTPLPIIVISELLGVEPERRDDFKRWSDAFVSARSTRLVTDPNERKRRDEEMARNGYEMFVYFSQVMASRRREPKLDLISRLVHACDHEQSLTEMEVLSLVGLLLVAANETTTNLIGNATLALLSHPEEWRRLKEAPALIPAMVEEALRYDGPVLSLMRRVTEPTILGGFPIPKNAIVMTLCGSANHDESKFPEPERFDIQRNTQGHLAFGGGVHFCLGVALARLEARVVFEEVLSAFKALDRSDEAPLPRIDSVFVRGLSRLPLTFSAQ